MYKMYLGINDGEEGFILPVLPEKIEFDEDGNNKTYDIINLGEINTINKPKLMEISFESFFPKHKGPYVSSEQLFEPSFYIAKIREWRDKKQKIRFIFTGSPLEINDLFTIENFKPSEEAGEVGDVHYSIELKRYKNYAAKKVVIVTPKTAAANQSVKKVIANSRATRPSNTNKPKTHTVSGNDTLWHIAKRYLGDGNKWPQIYNLNKDKIKNPNLIYTGQVLKLP
ncbi:LysM peptidoglycan-binding domain-containing protein [Clostridium botulinum]|uniref:LysM peptidoglycan-binding domain-containing protein n=1 Tax=Clostridium botulinum TaxID=1491 RepID=UPI000D391CD3|nr:LysM peptidoglycan-binding domain-containing protein [Clostridium botulinum]AWB31519.1 LysM domain-containing protein [Clostridium botulinum]MBY6829254.1 LysM peptidoglycan-binding domain-containing protein [Clostridium botulinum]MBY6941503.1 LysM peptidoglycan-binding domain-containing protein [Clostridium botulinum]MBY6962373.1 LysM peptidoglycan-binding domain-containing protein [Clostridium botulinum]MBY6997581.1 LysM peptidoglycan-binding domain-containing protein [Clostridium botulinu